MNRKPISKKGYENLQDELQKLIREDRPKIIKDIEVARAHGDLKENAEYHAAKEKQGFIEGRIRHLNEAIACSEIIDISKIDSDTVRFGATVTYEDVDTEEEYIWKIVGEEETDVGNRKISIRSPIALSLLGKEVGDDIRIKVPKGIIEVEITDIEYK